MNRTSSSSNSSSSVQSQQEHTCLCGEVLPASATWQLLGCNSTSDSSSNSANGRTNGHSNGHSDSPSVDDVASVAALLPAAMCEACFRAVLTTQWQHSSNSDSSDGTGEQ
jgi:hypothetical protein